MADDLRKKKESRPICADCKKREHFTGICAETGKKVNRSDAACGKLSSNNPRF